MRSKLSLIIGVMAVIAFSCKKNNDAGENLNPTGVSLADKLKDSALLYSRDIYLCYSQIPGDFKARTYNDPDAIMEAIRPYSKQSGFADPVDRWSFGIKKTEWDNLSGGIAKDFGLNVFFKSDGDLRVRTVEKASPAGLAGIRRGWRITKVNGNAEITIANQSFLQNAIYVSDASSFTFQKPDGSSADIALTSASYQEHPVFLDSVYTLGAKKAGYMVYNSFLGDSAETVNEFQRVFSRFSAENVDDVIIDLRYNGGGYVFYQRVLANYLINNAGNGNTMMKTEYNDKYSQYNSTTKFSKTGTLNLSRIFFIVSKYSASASELLINNLKPYMDVVLVGPDKTYGKPVGYFNIGVGDWYIFPVSSRTTNKNGEGNYFNGFALNNTAADGIDKDWGHTDESSLASTLKYISTGAFRIRSKSYQEDPVVIRANNKFDEPAFKGMIDARRF
ncbi:MAG: S41 family peptidase [Chitinophagaceae bacterium]